MMRICRALVLGLVLSIGAQAQFVTIDVIPFRTSSITTTTNYVYVANENAPTVLVYDIKTGVSITTVSLISAATRQVTGVTALATASDGAVIVGTMPHGEMFRIQTFDPFSMGLLPPMAGGDTYTRITAITAHQGRLFIGGRAFADTRLSAFRTSNQISVSGAARIDFPDTNPRVVRDLDAFDSFVAIGTEDTTGAINRQGRLYLYNITTDSISRAFTGDSAVTAVSDNESSILFASAPTGNIRNAFVPAGIAATVPETQVNTMLFSRNGAETDVFIGSETNVLRILTGEGRLITLGTVNALMTRIRDLAFANSPERIWGIGENNAGTSYLFYYDTVAPVIESIKFEIDTPLRQPGRVDTFPPPLTRGNYTVRIKTIERLSALTVTLTYSDGETQAVIMRTTDSVNFVGEFTIDSTRATGIVVITVVAVDLAGNRGTLTGVSSTFENRDIGRAVIANNLFKPGLGEFMTIRYVLFSPQNVSIRIYNMRGRLVADISPGFRSPGEYQDAIWRGNTGSGERLGSGVYLVRFEAGEYATTMKTMMVR